MTSAPPRAPRPAGRAAPAADPPGAHRPGLSPSRRRGLARLAVLVVVALVVVGSGVGYALYRHLDGNLTSVDVSRQLGIQRPADPVSGDLNLLVLGSDSRAGTGSQYGGGLSTAQSDTMLLVHLAAGRRWAAVVSIPRDSWVSIPSCQEGTGTMSTPHSFKINEAFTLGALHGGTADGAACSIKTVEAATGVHVDHFVVVDFNGFKDMTTALGGVPVCVSAAVNDPKSNLHLPAGRSTISGEQALGFVRARYTLGDGSDLSRIGRQQQFLASMARTARGKLSDPPAMYSFLDAATKSVTTDSGLGSLSALARLAASVQSLPSKDLEFYTVPTHPRSDVVPADKANVLWSQPAAGQLFTDLAHDVDPAVVPARPSAPAPSLAAPPSTPPVQVINASGVAGRAATVAAELRAKGFTVSTVSTAASHQTRTSITASSSPAARPGVAALAALVPTATTKTTTTTTTGGGITLVIGTDWTSLAPTPAPSPTAAAAPALNGQQDTCTRT